VEKNLLSEHTTKGLSIFSNIVIKSVNSTRTIAPEALIAYAIAAATAPAAPAAAAPLVISDSL
jgi:hypothetical protein